MSDVRSTQKRDEALSKCHAQMATVVRYVKLFFSHITVEPIMLLYAVGLGFIPTVLNELYFDKMCRTGSHLFGNGTFFDKQICDDMDSGNYTEVQIFVQQQIGRFNSVSSLLQNVPTLIFILLMGPWSDVFGRKFLIAFPLVGFLLLDAVFIVNAFFFEELSADFLLLEALQDLTGGQPCLLMGLNSYVSDISGTKERTMRLAFLQVSSTLGSAIAYYLSGTVYRRHGFFAVFGISAALWGTALVYCLLFVRESRRMSPAQAITTAPKNACAQAFNFGNVRQSFHTIFRRRPGGSRAAILLLVLFSFLYEYNARIKRSIDFLFIRKRFQWDDDEFVVWISNYISLGNVISIVTIGIVTPLLSRWLKMPDTVLLLLGCLGSTYAYVIYLCVHQANLLYLAYLNLLGGALAVGMRSILSKLVDSSEFGRAFAGLAFTQAFVGLISPTSSLLYSATVSWHEGFVFCVACSFYLIMAVMSCIMHVLVGRRQGATVTSSTLSNAPRASRDGISH